MKYADLSQVLYFVKVYPIAPTTSMDPYPITSSTSTGKWLIGSPYTSPPHDTKLSPSISRLTSHLSARAWL